LQYDPLKDSVFVNAILNDSIGFVTLNYPEFGDLVVYFRWIPSPSDKVKESKFLLAVGMLYEIEDDYTHVITPLIVVLIVVTLFINYVLLFFVNHYYYEKEKIKSKQNNE
jgi:hypothetical protein